MTQLTVLMPAYNAARFIGEAIEGILQQSFADFELLVLDDGSQDATASLVEGYARRDRRVHLLRRGHQGQVASRNELLSLAGTDIIAWADADDISLPQRFALQLAAMRDRPHVVALGTMMRLIDETGNPAGTKWNPVGAELVEAELERRVTVAQTSSMMRRAAVISAGGYREAYTTAEDYDLLLRLARFGTLDNLDAFCVLYRENPYGVTSTSAAQQLFVADMARATHRLRTNGLADPTNDLKAPPDVEAAALDAIMPDDILFHRAMRRASYGDRDVAEAALRDLLRLKLPRRRTRLVQRVLADHLFRRPIDWLDLKIALRGVRLGPRRFLKLALAHTAVQRPRQLRPGISPAATAANRNACAG